MSLGHIVNVCFLVLDLTFLGLFFWVRKGADKG